MTERVAHVLEKVLFVIDQQHIDNALPLSGVLPVLLIHHIVSRHSQIRGRRQLTEGKKHQNGGMAPAW